MAWTTGAGTACSSPRARRPRVQTLQQAMAKTLADPEVSGRIRSTGQEPVGSPTADFQAFFKSEIARFARVIEAAQIPKLD